MHVISSRERKGTEARGTCTVCGKESREDQEMLKIRFEHYGSSIFLCERCLRTLHHVIGTWIKE